ncbi:MAG TPA: manganese catalase family protein [Sphingomonas sp.]|nr:manganese catalase family protein [Sphingomonas sp.]
MSTAVAIRPAIYAPTSPRRRAPRSFYERLINITDDPGVKEALGFLMTREVAHQKSFEKALYSIKDNFPPGKLPGIEKYASIYVNTSQGDGDMEGPWNSGEQWERIDDIAAHLPVDGKSNGKPTVELTDEEQECVEQMDARLASQPSDPLTGAELGAGPGAGRTGKGDKGGAADIEEASEQARAMSF